MGWADPTNWAEPNPKRLGLSRPDKDWVDLGPIDLSFFFLFFFILGWSRPSKLGWAKTGPA